MGVDMTPHYDSLIGQERHMLTYERLIEVLVYDPKTGFFTHRYNRSGRAQKGVRAGWMRKRDSGGFYRVIQIDDRWYSEARLAVLYMTGFWPTRCIRHSNKCYDDNSWNNLTYIGKPRHMIKHNIAA
jgi:hypothetical protein